MERDEDLRQLQEQVGHQRATITRLMAVLDGVSDAILLVDGAWRVTYANRQAEALLTVPAGRFDAQRVAEYGYKSGDILGSSGHLRITVTDKQATVEYVRALLPTAETNSQRSMAAASSYACMPRQ